MDSTKNKGDTGVGDYDVPSKGGTGVGDIEKGSFQQILANYALIKDKELNDKLVAYAKSVDDRIIEIDRKYNDNFDKIKKDIMQQARKIAANEADAKAKTVVNDVLTEQLWPNVISVFGIFASVTTLILVEVQVFRVYCDPSQILGLSLIFAAVLLLFIFLLLSFYRKSESSQIHPNNLGIIFGVLILLGSLLFAHGTRTGRCYDADTEIEINNNSNTGGAYVRTR